MNKLLKKTIIKYKINTLMVLFSIENKITN